MGWFRIVKWILQIFFTIFLLFISIKKLDFSELAGIFDRMNKLLILLVVVFLFLDIFLNSYRIKRLYKLYDVEAGVFRIVLIRFYSLFFTLIFPFLGDVYKIQAFKTAYGASYGKNTFVVLLDKLIHTYALIIIVLPFWMVNSLEIDINLNPYLLGLFLVLTLILVLLNMPGLLRFFMERMIKISKHFQKIQFHYTKRTNYFREVIMSTGISIIRHIIIGLLHVVIAYAVFQKIDFNVFMFLLIVFLIMLAQIIPLSVGGIGLREFIAVSVFPMIGISSESAFMIAFIISSIIILQGIGGGLTYLMVQTIKIRK